MPIRLNGNLVCTSRHAFLPPVHSSLNRSTTFSGSLRYASNDAYRQRIAVIGGGITGLTAAYILSKRRDIHVTLYEASQRLGGWIQSKLVDVPGGRVLFEQGPRSLRPSIPNGFLTASLVCLVNASEVFCADVVEGRGDWSG
jgi:hypothetical protein